MGEMRIKTIVCSRGYEFQCLVEREDHWMEDADDGVIRWHPKDICKPKPPSSPESKPRRDGSR